MARTDSRTLTPKPLTARVGGQAARWVDDFRRSDRFFRMRLAVVGTWVLLSLATLWVACPSSGPTNSLGADVQMLRESLVGGQQLLVRNESSEIWTDVVLTLDDGWRFEHRTMRPHDQLVLSMNRFRRGDQAAPREFRPRTLTIECGQGKHTFDLR
jgi:hypothetical protein